MVIVDRPKSEIFKLSDIWSRDDSNNDVLSSVGIAGNERLEQTEIISVIYNWKQWFAAKTTTRTHGQVQ